jgi:hypothetical protein
MSSDNFKDARRANDERQGRSEDRRGGGGTSRRADDGRVPMALQPGASNGGDRRKDGDARPDRFPKQASFVKPIHIWGAAAFVAIIVGLSFFEVSGGHISGLFSDSDKTRTVESTGSNFDEPESTDSKRSNLSAGPAPGTSLARTMSVDGIASIDTSSCPAMPKVAIWGGLTHQRVINFVARRHNGEWDSYLDKWDAQAQKIKDIYDRGSAIRIGKDKIKIEGARLAKYADEVRQRANVNHCLAKLLSASKP